ncbi:terminase, partial [Acinetobacter baumannii]
VYYPFDRKEHVGKYPFDPKLPIWIGMDFNIDPMSTVIMQPQPNGEVWVVDEIVQFGSNKEEICEEIERKYWRYMKQ